MSGQAYHGISPHIPADLAESCAAAEQLINSAISLIDCGRLKLGEHVYEAICNRMRGLADTRLVIERVLIDLITISEDGSRFGATCAHEAAVHFYQRAWLAARGLGNTDYSEWLLYLEYRDIKWPDHEAIRVACRREAHLAAAARRKAGALRADATVEEPPVPVLWYHGERSYSLDRSDQKVVPPQEHNVLQVFLQSPVAKTTVDLEKTVSNVSVVMKSLARKFGQVPVGPIRMPGNKGDGYFVLVKSTSQS
ncbi:unnamed protein product [Gemmata massiliana]|uniref:Uncharacterized protein n=1 Tax=Gemmata massiliana TaxID=1210884 RepID=A0A6P2DC40_9BACT|nr:hypothetical protein [Gemmata massiliana]VTR98834.1 unnamed protein product [Gemmata massiliana]